MNNWNWYEFSAASRRRSEAADGFGRPLSVWDMSDWFLAIGGELGEAMNVAKKLNRVRDGIAGNQVTEEVLRQMLAKEMADVFIYLDLAAQAFGIDLPAAVVAKFNETSKKIGYPLMFSMGG